PPEIASAVVAGPLACSSWSSSTPSRFSERGDRVTSVTRTSYGPPSFSRSSASTSEPATSTSCPRACSSSRSSCRQAGSSSPSRMRAPTLPVPVGGEREADREARPGARLAVRGDPATVLVDQQLDVVQAGAEATEGPPRAGCQQRLEDALEIRGADALAVAGDDQPGPGARLLL